MKPKDHIYVYADAVGAYRWERISAEGQVLAVSGHSFHELADCEQSARRCNAKPYELTVDATEPPAHLPTTDDTVILDRQAPA